MTTAVQVQYRRGTATQVAAFTGAQGELVIDTTNNRVVVQDGSTIGGWPAARAVDLPIISRTAIADANYTALTTDRNVAYTTLSAARTISLPAAASFPIGVRLTVLDESGLASGTLSVSLAANGTDQIDGAANVVINSAYGYVALESNGSNKWTIVDQTASNLVGVGIGTAIDPNNVLSVTGLSALFSSTTNFNVTVNKGGSGGNAADTASFIFEDGFSGRAQIGLCGDDNFRFKVSSNGSTWSNPLTIIASNGNVGIGTETNPQVPLVVSQNATTGISAADGSALAVIGANTANASLTLVAYGGNCVTTVLRADGTAASPTALAAGDIINVIGAGGYNGSAFTAGNRARVVFYAEPSASNWTTADNGTEIGLETMKSGTTTRQEVLRLLNGYNVKFSNAASWTANGATAASLGSTSPGNATPQEWLTIVDSGGTTRYIPCF
jgi:hypothetical protein